MRKFKVYSEHDVHVDDYTQGELEHVNSYDISETVKANSIREAIEKYFRDVLFYDFDFNSAGFDEEFLEYTVLVNEDQQQPTQRENELWKEGKKQLFANYIRITVEELVSCKIKE